MKKFIIIGIVILVIIIAVYYYLKPSKVTKTELIEKVVQPVIVETVVMPKMVNVLPSDAVLLKSVGTNLEGTTTVLTYTSKSTGYTYTLNRYNGRTGGYVQPVYYVSKTV